jgi:hypothetical protein
MSGQILRVSSENARFVRAGELPPLPPVTHPFTPELKNATTNGHFAEID